MTRRIFCLTDVTHDWSASVRACHERVSAKRFLSPGGDMASGDACAPVVFRLLRNISYLTIYPLLLFAMPAPAQQQPSPQSSNGTYTTHVGDRHILTETFRITSQPDGSLVAEAELTPAAAAGGGAKQKINTSASKTKAEKFSVEIGGVKTLEAKFGDGLVKLNMAGQPEREVKTKATVVLENLIWHQFIFLINGYDQAKGGQQNFTAFLPSQGVEYPISLEYLSAQTYTLKDRTMVKTHRYKAVAAGALELQILTDEARVPLLFQVEAQKVKVVRQGAESLAEVAFAAPAEYKAPAYVVPASFGEQELTVGAGSEWSLPATLTLPLEGKGPFPAIVLVHGSGPNDRDETLGANKPFRDLAWGLASQGIAVLRYEKRTRQHPARFGRLANFTVKEETTADALAAIRLLRGTAGVDEKKIFVLGHSLGGMLVPRIGVADEGIAGFIVMAGPTRPLEDAFARQYEYGALLDGNINDAERAQIDDAKRQATLIKALRAGDTSGAQLLGAPPSYWLDLRSYDPPQMARTLKRPLLILQGERDYNVTLDDFRNWQTLSAQKEIAFKTYPKLDHFFYEGEGAASGADYARPRNIPKYVIDDIAAWIKGRV